MSADKLLLWMSARTRGSWSQFRGAVEELHLSDDGAAESVDVDEASDGGLPLYQRLRLNLQRLGHTEFLSSRRGLEWRVTPPSLAIVPQPRGVLAVLAGARSNRLLDRLSAVAGEQLVTSEAPCCPTIIRLQVEEARQIESVASEAGICVQKDAARALLACVPAVDDPLVRQRAELPAGAGWRIEQFEPRGLRWVQAERDAAIAARRALFRFTFGYQRHVLLCDRGTCFQIPAQVGKFVVARRRHRRLLRYDRAARTLAVPAICRPPFLIERALVLCSGELPRYRRLGQGGGVLEYFEVSDEVAGLAGSLLRQELR